jgi:2'-5' RNA ligase
MAEVIAQNSFRLFLALRLPEAVLAELARVQNELRRAVPDGSVRWTKRAQLHLTLRFLGNVEEAKIAALTGAAVGACAEFSPLSLLAAQIGFFPEQGFPRVIWAGVQDATNQLTRLQQALRSATLRFTAEAAEQKFSSHVTLGRAKAIRRPQAETLTKLGASLTGKRFGFWTAQEVELIRSELSSAGPRYSTLGRFALTRPSSAPSCERT